jgi:hypothetical protein
VALAVPRASPAADLSSALAADVAAVVFVAGSAPSGDCSFAPGCCVPQAAAKIDSAVIATTLISILLMLFVRFNEPEAKRLR